MCIPISKETAALILVQEQRVTDESENKFEYVFPRKDGSLLKQATFRDKLNELGYEEKITDNKGEIFRFHAHAFRIQLALE